VASKVPRQRRQGRRQQCPVAVQTLRAVHALAKWTPEVVLQFLMFVGLVR
jgi:hypothetical protein